MTFVDTFLGLTSLGAKPDMEQVNNAIKMDDPYEVVRMFCEANGMGREDFTASFVAPHEYSFFISGIPFPEEVRDRLWRRSRKRPRRRAAVVDVPALARDPPPQRGFRVTSRRRSQGANQGAGFIFPAPPS